MSKAKTYDQFLKSMERIAKREGLTLREAIAIYGDYQQPHGDRRVTSKQSRAAK
jgi:hypothetical protein